MKVLPEPILFEWDKANKNKNYLKHKVVNEEAEGIFTNKPSYILFDEKHSIFERRYLIWGKTDRGRKLAVFFTIRNNKITIISARDMQKKERRAYEEKTKINS